MSSPQNLKTPAKSSKNFKKASSKKFQTTIAQNAIQDIINDSDCDADPVHLAALLNKAKISASVDPTKLESKGFKTKAFKNGKFIDPIGDSVKRQLYIQDISAKAESSINSKSSKLSFYKKAVDGTEKLGISASIKAGFTKDPQTCVEQALALSKTKGIDELKIKYELAEKLSKAESTKLKESNAGSKWFNMPAPTMTPELKRDLELLSLRGVLDRKRFYKRADKQPVSKFLQVGTIVEDKSEFYSARIAKKDRKSNMVQELLHDSVSQKYFNSRFNQLQQTAAQNCRKPSTKRFKSSYSKRK